MIEVKYHNKEERESLVLQYTTDDVFLVEERNFSGENVLIFENLTEKAILEREEELVNNLKPTEKEVLMAEIELNTLNLLSEMEVI